MSGDGGRMVFETQGGRDKESRRGLEISAAQRTGRLTRGRAAAAYPPNRIRSPANPVVRPAAPHAAQVRAEFVRPPAGAPPSRALVCG